MAASGVLGTLGGVNNPDDATYYIYIYSICLYIQYIRNCCRCRLLIYFNRYYKVFFRRKGRHLHTMSNCSVQFQNVPIKDLLQVWSSGLNPVPTAFRFNSLTHLFWSRTGVQKIFSMHSKVFSLVLHSVCLRVLRKNGRLQRGPPTFSAFNSHRWILTRLVVQRWCLTRAEF